jgi:hypothetical protein
MSSPHDNLLSFIILSLIDIDCLLVLDIDEVFTGVSKDLPPSRVSLSRVDSEFLRFSVGLDVP